MPYYWRQRWRPRRRTFWRRRIRTTFPRRWRRRRYRRRRYRVRRFLFKRKLKKLKLIQWQPKTIRKCNVIGLVPLFQGSPERASFNYIQHIYGFVPEDEPGGGGWTLMVETLSSLWEDWEHLKNVWTNSNAGLPLVRFLGYTLTFYQDAYTDYIVDVFNCLPMVDSEYKHADSAPSRMMQKRNTIRVPSLETKRRKKPYKRRHFRPPSQLQNKWYFQKDICRIPLTMITATAVSFRYPFCGSNCKSNNLTLTCLNPILFNNHNFANPQGTLGYTPNNNRYLYSIGGRTITKPDPTNLIYLGDTKNNTPGKVKQNQSMSNKGWTEPGNWGNPFWHHYIDGSIPVFSSDKSPTTITETEIKALTELAEPYFKKYRYNPERDTGASNRIYLKENFQGSGWNPPQNPDLQMEGFPLFDMLWGFVDWQQKLHAVQDIYDHYILCIQTQEFNEPAQCYIPIDLSYRNGEGPYETTVSNFDNNHWYPKARFQTKSINDLCLTGPHCPRPHFGNYIQAKMKYEFHFKWGGCPQTLEKPYDPCSQPSWIVPSNQLSGLQITNPNTNPATELQEWDWRRDYVTQKAIKRIQKHTPIDETLQIFTDSEHNPGLLRQTHESSTDEETEEEKDQEPIQTQIHKLKQRQRLLKHRILNRLKLQSIVL
nr:MAG: ORF1 [TTV-like mini virus]